MHIVFGISAVVWTFFAGCEGRSTENPPKSSPEASNEGSKYVNRFIWEVMESHYYWAGEIPSYYRGDYKQETDSWEFWKKLLHSEDTFSYLTDKVGTLESRLTTGNSKGVGIRISAEEQANGEVSLRILYSVPNSPAARAGLKRGDRIVAIKGTRLTKSNYAELLAEKSYEFTIQRFQKNKYQAEERLSLVPEEVQHRSILKDTVLVLSNSETLGYMCYLSFLPKDTVDIRVSFRDKLNSVSHLVIDLRYNPGGSASTMHSFAEWIAPPSAAGNVFIKYEYNALISNYLRQQGRSTVLRFRRTQKVPYKSVSFLVSGNSASASEGLIIGLRPYVGNSLRVIGGRTVGKNYGSYFLKGAEWGSDKDLQKGAKDWGILPLVFRLTNSQGDSYSGGILPSITAKDDPSWQLGDTNDPMLKEAINAILSAGGVAPATAGLPLSEVPLREADKIFPSLRPIPVWENFPKVP